MTRVHLQRRSTTSSTRGRGTPSASGSSRSSLLFWLATVYWVNKDARRRIEDPFLVALATLIGAIPPFLGPLIYMLFRPPEYLEDVRERELEIRAIESRLGRARDEVQGVRLRGRARLPRLPRLHDEAPLAVRELQPAARARRGRSARTARPRCRSRRR